jgi:hypothetical protein
MGREATEIYDTIRTVCYRITFPPNLMLCPLDRLGPLHQSHENLSIALRHYALASPSPSGWWGGYWELMLLNERLRV